MSASAGSRGDGGENPRDNRRFQMRLALVGVAGAIVASVIGAVIGLKPWSHSSPSSPSPTITSPTATTPGTTTSSVSTRSPVYFQGSVLISGFPGLDFDINPPGAGPGAVSISYNTFSLAGGSSTVGLAVWTSGGTPTAADCKTWVSTQQVPNVYQPVAGMKICFKTDQGRIGLLQVMPGTSENQFKATATVWDHLCNAAHGANARFCR
jgi:hypothetical protein